MKRTALGLLLVVGMTLPSCQRTPPTAVDPAGKQLTQREDVLKSALDLLRQGTDLAQHRDALHLVNTHLTKDTARPVTPFSSEERATLQKLCQLDNDEMAEIDATHFRPADAHHLHGCFLFRDASRMLEIAQLSQLEQVRLCFQWIVRRIQPHEQGDEWLPPAYVLRRGFGGARDRAITFLALLRQFQIDGCLLAPPGPPVEPSSPILAGVLSSQGGKPGLFLFDPRLGQPIAGPKGQGIATLEDARAQPELLKPSDIAADALPKLQLYQVSPLEALSPRMRLLQELLAFQDKVTLFQDAAGVAKELAKVGGRDATFWNAPPPSKGPPPPSPLRALRLFLPPEEGGIDKQGRLKRFQFQQIPWAGIMQQLQRMQLFQPKDLPEPAREALLANARELFNTFYLQPEELFLRGQFEAMLQRVRRIRTVLETEEAAKPLEEAALQKRLQDWRDRVKAAYIALVVRNEPGGQAKVNALWTEDQYVLNLLQVDSEIPLHKFEKKTLSLILFEACRESLGQQVTYLVASSWHEKAAQLQAHQDALQAAGKDTSIVQKDAALGWANSRGAWSKYLERYRLNPTDKFNARDLPLRLDEIHLRFGRGDLATALDLLEHLHLDMHAAFEARLRLAEAQQKLQTATSSPALKDLLAELDAFQKSALPKNLTKYLENARAVPPLAQRLELLARDWAPQGNLFWLRRLAQARLTSAK